MKVLGIIALVLMVIAMPMCGYIIYNTIQEFPEEAQKKNLYNKYAPLISDIDNAIDRTESVLSLAAALETIEYPPGTIHVGITKNDETAIEVIPAPKANTRKTLVYNGAGYGQIGSVKFWIIRYKLDRYNHDNIEIYIERTPVGDGIDSGNKSGNESTE